MSFGNSASSSANTPTTTTNNNQVQGGSAQIGAGSSGNSALSLSGGTGSSFNVTQADPGLVAANLATTQAALQAVTTTAAGSLGIASTLADSALADISNKTESQTQQLAKLAVPVGIVIAVAVVAWLILRK